MLLQLCQMHLPAPWRQVAGLVLGLEAFSLLVQLAGMAGLATGNVLGGLWGLLALCGGVAVWHERTQLPKLRVGEISRGEGLGLGICGAALCLNLLAALPPATKIDEVYYHLVLPSRLVLDEGLRFYRQPWQGAILPQMTYQLASAPLYALHYPDAMNVVSWALSGVWAWFVWLVLRKAAVSHLQSSIWTAALLVGMYSIVWHVTAGGHALGDLAMTAALMAAFQRRELLAALGERQFISLVSILCLGAASTKLSLWPVLGVLLVWLGVWLSRQIPGRTRWEVWLWLCLPWIVLSLPLLLWTWRQSGSPFGPVLSQWFSHSVYEPRQIQAELTRTREVNRLPIREVVGYALINYPPLLWLGMLGALLTPKIPLPTRMFGALLLAIQLVLLVWLLPFDLRFLGALPAGLMCWWVIVVAPRVQTWAAGARPLAIVIAAVFLLPWLLVKAYYAKQFVPILLGQQARAAFFENSIGLLADYRQLDKLLPRDAVLFRPAGRFTAAYAPRPVLMDVADLPAGRAVFLLGTWPQTVSREQSLELIARFLPAGFSLGEIVYENPKAIWMCYRTPGKAPDVVPIFVARLIRQ
ncbi:MAG: hypothetical protein HYR56_25205 [Acidobacteria bacterium]|nr:hypothetical protein [Acidobacteriota bacterium]